MECSMRIVTIRAGHESFVDPVFERKRELRPHIGMAPVTELGLRPREQPGRRLRPVNGMAACACHSVQSMFRPADIRAADRLAMAPQARVESALGGQFRERDDGGFAAVRLDVRRAGPMAAFASSRSRGFFFRAGPEMRIPVKRRIHVRVARLARFAPNVLGGTVCGYR